VEERIRRVARVGAGAWSRAETGLGLVWGHCGQVQRPRYHRAVQRRTLSDFLTVKPLPSHQNRTSGALQVWVLKLLNEEIKDGLWFNLLTHNPRGRLRGLTSCLGA
jgi:hypothetical protein